MAYGSENQLRIPGLVAGGNLAAHQYKAVKMASTVGAVIVAAAATDQVVGILQNDPAEGEPAIVCAGGITKALRGTTIAAGAHVASDTTGQLQTTSSANDTVVGMCIIAGSTAGDLVTVLVGGPSNF